MDEPRERSPRLIEGHDLLALPAVDADERMAGILTVDAARDGAREASPAPPPYVDRGRGTGT